MISCSKLTQSALAVAAFGLFASASAHADSLVLTPYANALTFNVNVTTVASPVNVKAGYFSVTDETTASAFKAFCIELLQGVSTAALTTPGISFDAASNTSANVQRLFNQSYDSLGDFSDKSKVAGFQIALWETLDDDNLSTGNYSGWSGASSNPLLAGAQNAALTYAADFLNNVNTNAPATDSFNLTLWTNATSQDLIQANRVAEPATALLSGLGLAGLAALRRRKA